MAITDPLDIRLLSALADVGKIAVHELAAQVGMDPREVAYRLVTLSGSGLPLLVGVESDAQGLKSALLGVNLAGYPQNGNQPPMPPAPNSSPQPFGMQQSPVHNPPLAPPMMAAPPRQTAPSTPNPAFTTWGPPQTSAWVRETEPTPPPKPATVLKGRIGDKLATQGLEGEHLVIQLLEVQDPADFLFGAAGYRLIKGERAVVVHTEVANQSDKALASLPDNYLELITADGRAISKAPVSLSSRLPHRIGIRPGETVGGHTVYLLDESIPIASVRWSPRPEPDGRTLLWSIE